jgi:vanillate O-demethylase ferredoxin subunit
MSLTSTTSTGRWTTAEVDDVGTLVPGVRELVLRYDEPVLAPPGSHLDLMVHVRGADAVRSYSIVSAGPGARTVRLAVRLATDGGGGSRYVHGLRVGDRIRVTTPRQSFPLDHGRPGYVLVAGGIGITALAAMFRLLAGRGVLVRLVQVGRDRAAMPLLAELSTQHPDLVESVVSAEGGRVDADALVAAVPDGHQLYVCGPLGLLESLRRAWASAGRPAAALRFETFGGSGSYAPEDFVVEVPSQGLRTVVPVGTSILDALTTAGAAAMADCRRGECGLCEVRVLSCEGVLDHRDVFLSAAQHATGRTLCTCVTRAVAGRGAGDAAVVRLELP